MVNILLVVVQDVYDCFEKFHRVLFQTFMLKTLRLSCDAAAVYLSVLRFLRLSTLISDRIVDVERKQNGGRRLNWKHGLAGDGDWLPALHTGSTIVVVRRRHFDDIEP